MKTLATRLYPFVPSDPHFARSLDFFAALGFETVWQHNGLAGLRCGGAYFILQDIDVAEWQKNQMITFEVEDLDAYWSELETGHIVDSFPGVKLRPPTQFPWGREIHIMDPGGVCWHVRCKPRAGPRGRARGSG
jgi:catechol 2,3-dioxygenase-like lactoylglutathione lyase family enzyme